ncbi:MAG: Smr/MutS family protein [Spirochaetales bacterium]
MDLTTFETLEFPRILAQVADCCMTAEAARELPLQPVLTNRQELQSLQAEVKPLLTLLIRVAELPAADFPEVEGALERCGPEGSVLDGQQLKAIARYLSSASVWKRFLAAREEESLKVWALRLGDHSAVAQAVHQVLDATGQVMEEAVPALMHLRGEIQRTRMDIDTTARGFLKDVGTHDLWQDSPPIQRDGRTVLSLKSNFKGRIAAVVHEASASGATLFVEPYELVEKNNRLAENHSAWKAELARLFRELTAQIREHREAILTTVANLTWLDSRLARARWGLRFRCEFPSLAVAGEGWQLLQARHPLLGNSAVPVDLVMPPHTSILLLSGPNTGGKTVSLKTVGLLSLLHQFGLPVPAAAESRLPLWDAVFTDVGDHQSLDQALSTFSSHMDRMAQVFRGTSAQSLVLLDEMASGTDPQEGGALGMSFLEHFLGTGATVLGTTHHGALKNFAFTRAGVKNASVEFDAASGKPTYRIVPDVPGTSYALETAQRVGIPQALVDRARQILEGGETDVAKVITTLRDKQRELAEREKELALREAGFQDTRRKTDLLALRLKQRENELKESGLGEVNRFLSDSRKAFEKFVKDIREGESLTTEKIKQVRGFLAETAETLAAQKQQLEQERVDSPAERPDPTTIDPTPADEWQPGQLVAVDPGNQRGTLLRRAGRDRYVVAIGSVNLTVKLTQLRAIRQTTKPPRKVEISTSGLGTGSSAVFSLDLRGQRLSEAVERLEKQVDAALLSGLGEFSIIHGLGEGVLQKGVQDYLKGRREVRKFFFSHPEEGGYGKTIVQL